jgi:hypothetical protein
MPLAREAVRHVCEFKLAERSLPAVVRCGEKFGFKRNPVTRRQRRAERLQPANCWQDLTRLATHCKCKPADMRMVRTGIPTVILAALAILGGVGMGWLIVAAVASIR